MENMTSRYIKGNLHINRYALFNIGRFCCANFVLCILWTTMSIPTPNTWAIRVTRAKSGLISRRYIHQRLCGHVVAHTMCSGSRLWCSSACFYSWNVILPKNTVAWHLRVESNPVCALQTRDNLLFRVQRGLTCFMCRLRRLYRNMDWP